MNKQAENYINKLQLVKHPEGGYYREIYRAGEMFYLDLPPKNFKRNYSTSIYFLLEGKQISKFHRLKSDELWHFYDGSSLVIYIIDKEGDLEIMKLGRDINHGEEFQVVVKKNNWFASELVDKDSFALIGCTVSPGFDFSDFELGDKEKLTKQFVKHAELIRRLT